MTEHLHSEYVDGCYRCDLSRDEAFIAPHACDTGHFDRVVCPEPCGVMHSYCSFCDRLMDNCALDDEGGSMTTQPTWSRLDEATADLLHLVADPEHPVGRDAAPAFLAACRRDARANGGVVSVNRVRELLTDAQITARRYSSFWAEFTGPGKPMRVIPDAWEINLDKKGGNGGKPLRLREWVDFDE